VTRRLLATYLSLAVVVLAALEIPLGVTNERNERRTLTGKVERDAVAVASLAESTVEGESTGNLAAIRSVARRYAQDTDGRVVIVDSSGSALVDTSPLSPGSRSFASRPEFTAALRGEVLSGTRHSTTLGTSFLFVAVPVASGGRILGAVRITYPTSKLDARIRRYWLILGLIAAIVLLVAAVLGAGFARWIRRPLRQLEDAAAAVSAGDLATRSEVPHGPPELRTLAASFNDMVEQLEALVSSQQEFVADASHELRTPLTALRLRLDNLRAHVDERGRAGFEAAATEVGRLSAVVESLLTLARADAGTTAAAMVDLEPIVRERVNAWTAVATERAVRLVVVANAPVTALTSPDRLRQVVDNLIANALAVAPPGSTVTALIEPTPAQLVIRDEGPGMSDNDKRRAFDRFWRGRPSGAGSGLGLAIARRLVEIDGGTISLRDGQRGGLEVVIRLRTHASAMRESP
jgi:signal transduction histidine kinase